MNLRFFQTWKAKERKKNRADDGQQVIRESLRSFLTILMLDVHFNLTYMTLL